MIEPQLIRDELQPHRDRFMASLKDGRPENWTCDTRTGDVWCLSQWLSERFKALGDDRRRELLWMFSRIVRSVENVFEAASVVVHVGDNGLSIDDYAKDYWTAKRHNKWA